MKKLFTLTLFVLISTVTCNFAKATLTPPKPGYKTYTIGMVAQEGAPTQTAVVVSLEQPPLWPKPCIGYEEACIALQRAGFTGTNLAIMAGIGRGESGMRFVDGDQTLANSKWHFSYGPYQIRSLKAESGKGTCRDFQELKKNDWDFHARCAWEISGQATNYRPWTIFLNGSYKRFL